MSYAFNPFTRTFDVVSDSKNFSLKEVLQESLVESSQQMIVRGKLRIAEKLTIGGCVVILTKFDDSFKSVTGSIQQSRVKQGKEVYFSKIKNQGSVKVYGVLKIGKFTETGLVPYFILETEQYRINKNRTAVVFGNIKNQGSLKILGKLKIR